MLLQQKSLFLHFVNKPITRVELKEKDRRKLVLVFALLFSLGMVSCVKDAGQEKETGTVEGDTIENADTAQQVTGIAIDGAMNSVILKVGDDTLQFDYPELDPDHRASWSINDTVTVKYYVTASGDSVTDVVQGDIS